MSHVNEDFCPGCAQVLNRYPDFSEELRTWFLALRMEHPETHASCAGRGRIDQEVAFSRGASKAHYGESAHNCNAAIDLFELKDGQYTLDPAWFQLVVAPALYASLRWYGEPKASFYELPHVELRNWKECLQNGTTHLVE